MKLISTSSSSPLLLKSYNSNRNLMRSSSRESENNMNIVNTSIASNNPFPSWSRDANTPEQSARPKIYSNSVVVKVKESQSSLNP